MNDLDDLRDAMHTTPGFEPQPLDIAAVLTAGGRLRRRRRIAVGAASGLAVLALLVGGVQLTRLGTQQPGGVAAGQMPGTSTTATARPSASGVAEKPAGPDPGVAFGDVVGTGMTVEGLDRLLWMQRIDEPVLPDTSMGLVAGRRAADGELLVDVINNEVEGSDRAPGFHALEMAMVVNGQAVPAFGYYVGDAAKITVRADGRTVRAQQATWSEDRSIVLFWFALNKVKPTSQVGKAAAYDRDGRRLPAGNAAFGVG
jgi:hypothetical protein